MDTTQKIIKASIEIFTEHGYLGSSTKAIAEKAGVAEMTLFRKFKTKQNLFESMLRFTLGNDLTESTEFDFTLNAKDFIMHVLHNRLILISKNIKLVQMIIQESLQGRLTEELNFIQTMSKKFETMFERYHSFHNYANIKNVSKHVLGLILHYAVVEYSTDYHNLSREEQQEYLLSCIGSLSI